MRCPFFLAAPRIGVAARAAAVSRHWLPSCACSAVRRTAMRFACICCSTPASVVVRNAAWREGLRAGDYTPFYLALLVKERRSATMPDKRVWRTVCCKPCGTTVLERHRIFACATIGTKPRSSAAYRWRTRAAARSGTARDDAGETSRVVVSMAREKRSRTESSGGSRWRSTRRRAAAREWFSERCEIVSREPLTRVVAVQLRLR